VLREVSYSSNYQPSYSSKDIKSSSLNGVEMSKVLDEMLAIKKSIGNSNNISDEDKEKIDYVISEIGALEKLSDDIDKIISNYIQIKFIDDCKCKNRHEKWNKLERTQMYEYICDDVEEIIHNCSMINAKESEQVTKFDEYIKIYTNNVTNYLEKERPVIHKNENEGLTKFKSNMINYCDTILNYECKKNSYIEECIGKFKIQVN
jgi:hypothetical protein